MRGLAWTDALFNRLYHWRYNPLYQSGSLAVAFFIVLMVTGVYLLLYYRIGAPYDSVVRISDQAWTGRWIRGLHRYASGALVVAIAVHALRMGIQRRSWGPRVLAWVSGLVLVAITMVCGWTGYVMVWDTQGQALAVEGARFLDALPIFGEPIGRAFSGERVLPGAFFFLNLFLHILLPVGMALVLWLHVSRVSRPTLLPPRLLGWGTVALLGGAAVLWPAPLGEHGDLLRLPGEVPLDLFYGFWLPFTGPAPAGVAWLLGGGAVLLFLLVPRLQRPPPERAQPTSKVEERLCTGCEQCYLDCPYDAVQMFTREDGRVGLVARVTPELCVSCGICAGSCAPMGVGPPGRTGRDQLGLLREVAAEGRLPTGGLVVVACERGAGWVAREEELDGARVLPVSCAGNLHTSFVEGLIRSGAGGVLVAACPPRDCWNREGSKWMEARMYHDREAELQERVDRRRVGVAFAGGAEAGRVRDALADLDARVRGLDRPDPEGEPGLDRECDRGDREGDREGVEGGRPGGRRGRPTPRARTRAREGRRTGGLVGSPLRRYRVVRSRILPPPRLRHCVVGHRAGEGAMMRRSIGRAGSAGSAGRVGRAGRTGRTGRTGRIARIGRVIVAGGVALALAWGAAALTRVPVQLHSEDEARLRLSWRLDAAVVRECRAPTEAERERMPAHMTREEICEERIPPYRLTLRVNGEEVLDREVEARGARSDRPLSLFHEIPMEVGEHRIQVRFAPVGAAQTELPVLELDTVLVLEGRQVGLVSYDRDAGRLDLRTPTPVPEPTRLGANPGEMDR